MNKYFVRDTNALLGRSLRHILRSPDTIITTAVTPIAMLLMFVYVFGGSIHTGGGKYVNYLLPGILLITVASGVAYTSMRLYTDMSGGVLERFQSMPIARSAILWAHVLTSVIANLISLALVVLVAVAIGFRSGAGVVAWLEVLGIIVLFTLALTWLAVIAGLAAKSPDGAGAFAYPLLFLPFVSSAFVLTAGHARPGEVVRRAPARHVDRRHVAQPVRGEAARRRRVDRPRLVRRHPGRSLGACRAHLPPPARMIRPAHRPR